MGTPAHIGEPMNIDDLPRLERISAVSGTLAKRVVVLWFIQQTGRSRKVGVSQRQVLDKFNRSNRRVIARYLKEARQTKLLTKTSPSRGITPDTHVRGEFFSHRTREGSRLNSLANALWNPKTGILSRWPYSAAWGHGCVPGSSILILSVLSLLDIPPTRAELKDYLSPLIPDSAVSAGTRWLQSRSLLTSDQGTLLLNKNWRSVFEKHMQDTFACNERHERGKARRLVESEENRARVAKGTLTDAERQLLRTLPCVRHGCKRQALTIEHFPPRRFLGHLDDQTNIFLVFAMCKMHNRKEAEFIKALPDIKPAQLEFRWLRDNVDPLRVFSAISEIGIKRFQQALERDDTDAAVKVVGWVLGAWETLGRSTLHDQLPKPKTNNRPNRKIYGFRAHFPGRSSLRPVY